MSSQRPERLHNAALLQLRELPNSLLLFVPPRPSTAALARLGANLVIGLYADASSEYTHAKHVTASAPDRGDIRICYRAENEPSIYTLEMHKPDYNTHVTGRGAQLKYNLGVPGAEVSRPYFI